MAKFGVRILIALAILYAGLAAFLYFFQSSFIFPAPQTVHGPADGYEIVTLETQDGLALSAHWRAPEEGRPTVIHFHGNAGSLAGAGAENAVFAEMGYGLLLVEYRGYGGNPGTPSEAGFKLDGAAGMDFLSRQGVAPDAIIAKGHSIGAGTAVNLALDHRLAALILVAPFTSVPDLSKRTVPIMPLDLLVSHPFDNLAKASDISVPTLVQHGSADKAIPVSHGQRVAAAIDGAAFERVEGGRHVMSIEADVQASQIAWLAKQGL